MALKSEYNATRGDLKRLVKDVRPGDRLYVVHNIARNLARYEANKLYSEYIVTSKRAIASGQLTVCSASDPSGQGVESVGGLLSRERTVYTQLPAGIRDMAGRGPQVATDQQVGNAATRAMNRALEEDRASRRQPVAAGKKSRWW
ncbi:hypothetical protein ACGFMM_01440 [Streptomyces sp. NPDC048604]|uniref:hypothetical protein n=1 Tax=Streptomyces sp. NPDC048604 TaxID=3365578 RepID=UPI00371CB519